ncbi:hypothetical protein EsH8_VI_001087 [Colletotrichum jinshuiense]
MSHGTAFSSGLQSIGHADQPAPNPAHFPEKPASSQSYWIRNFAIDLDAQYQSVSIPEEVDVVIVGSGITGATVVHQLAQKRPDLRVALFEARGICTGATGRNGGHICRPEVYNIRELLHHYDAEDALRMRQMVLRNRDMLLDCIDELKAADDVDLRLNGTIVVFETAEERKEYELDIEFAAAYGHAHEGTILSAEEVIKKVGIAHAEHGAAFLEKSGTLYPRKFVNLLLRNAIQRMPTLSIHPFTPVTSVSKQESSSHPYTVNSEKGAVRSRAIFHATNGYAKHLISELNGIDGVYGCKAHMLGVQPDNGPSAPQLETGFGYADFWHWVQQTPNKGPFLYGLAKAEYLHDYDDTRTIPDEDPIKKEMVEFLESTFPRWFTESSAKDRIMYDWTGIQGFTANGASIVGRPVKGSPGEFVSVGHNGEGMARCFACATVATDVMLGYLDETRTAVPDWFPKAYWRDVA